ncbi:uncharacterized protein CELE_F41G4.7 [Caenorhabditis elegans]|uniref:Uncharacterized protein n=1 Tax=Caenorhabditis elegans TaxID=6239 RepID=Q8WTN3_CAEEL|nr:Uncharacterized protein CELE_F41G4.7 [Caenorhabditis elegans]CCD71062.2 Uncharacterized protein CELE_F41G4.7 [Caenorhabditis elegans]
MPNKSTDDDNSPLPCSCPASRSSGDDRAPTPASIISLQRQALAAVLDARLRMSAEQADDEQRQSADRRAQDHRESFRRLHEEASSFADFFTNARLPAMRTFSPEAARSSSNSSDRNPRMDQDFELAMELACEEMSAIHARAQLPMNYEASHPPEQPSSESDEDKSVSSAGSGSITTAAVLANVVAPLEATVARIRAQINTIGNRVDELFKQQAHISRQLNLILESGPRPFKRIIINLWAQFKESDSQPKQITAFVTIHYQHSEMAALFKKTEETTFHREGDVVEQAPYIAGAVTAKRKEIARAAHALQGPVAQITASVDQHFIRVGAEPEMPRPIWTSTRLTASSLRYSGNITTEFRRKLVKLLRTDSFRDTQWITILPLYPPDEEAAHDEAEAVEDVGEVSD